MSAASFFLASNLLAGVLNYIFQVVAARQLSAGEYAELTSWFAQVSAVMWIGVWGQFASSIKPYEGKPLRQLISAIALLTLSPLIWIVSDRQLGLEELGMMALITGPALALLVGQAQNRMMFYALGFTNLLAAICKLTVAQWNPILQGGVYNFAFSIGSASYPPILLLAAILWVSKKPVARPPGDGNSGQTIWAPAILAFAVTLAPQIDILVLSITQNTENFGTFSRASLFARAIFFLFAIVAQWLLPYQLRGNQYLSDKTSRILLTAISAVAGSVCISLLAPWANRLILHWEALPPLPMIFLACLNMSLVTWIFIQLQEFCVQNRLRLAVIIVTVVNGHFFIQMALNLDIQNYFLLAIVVHSCVVAFGLRTSKADFKP